MAISGLACAAAAAPGAARAQAQASALVSLQVLDATELSSSADLIANATRKPRAGSVEAGATPAIFVVRDPRAQTFSVSVPKTATLTNAVDGRTIEATLTATRSAGTGPVGGHQTLRVAGRIPVASTSSSGVYVGRVAMTMMYN